MIGTIASLTASIAMAATISTAPVTESNLDGWESAGTYRITEFDVCCNDPAGRQSASGKTLEYGDCAMNNVPFGTKVNIEGEEFTVVDRCAFDDTIDIFVENDTGVCHCNRLDYRNVSIKY